MSVRDITLQDTIDIKFTTRSFATGAPTTLAGTPVVSAYPGNSVTQLTAGITLTVDFDGVTGLHNVRVVATAANGYAAATDYALVITTGTVGGVSVVGEVIGEFTTSRSAAAVDLANGTDGLGAIKTDTAAILVDTGTTLDGRIPAALVSGRMDASVGAMAAGVVTATAVATGAIDADALAADAVAEIADGVWDEDATGHQTTGTFGQAIGDPVADTNTIYGAVVTGAAGATVAADIIALKAVADAVLVDTGTTLDAALAVVDGNVDSILADTGTDGVVVAAASKTGYALSTAGLAAFFTSDSGSTYAGSVAGSVVKETADNAGGSALTEAGIADAVWNEAQADHTTAGSFGEIATEIASILVDTAEIGAAGAGLTAINLPNQTMDIIGNITGNLSGSVGSVTGAVGSVTGAVGSVTGLTAADVGAIKVQTDKFVFTVANQVDANTQYINDTALTGDGGVTPWGPA